MAIIMTDRLTIPVTKPTKKIAKSLVTTVGTFLVFVGMDFTTPFVCVPIEPSAPGYVLVRVWTELFSWKSTQQNISVPTISV
jgi:hypothetical protein